MLSMKFQSAVLIKKSINISLKHAKCSLASGLGHHTIYRPNEHFWEANARNNYASYFIWKSYAWNIWNIYYPINWLIMVALKTYLCKMKFLSLTKDYFFLRKNNLPTVLISEQVLVNEVYFQFNFFIWEG